MPETDARLIEWHVGLLRRLLQQVIARREACGQPGRKAFSVSNVPSTKGSTINEVQDVIELPPADLKSIVAPKDPASVELGAGERKCHARHTHVGACHDQYVSALFARSDRGPNSHFGFCP